MPCSPYGEVEDQNGRLTTIVAELARDHVMLEAVIERELRGGSAPLRHIDPKFIP